MQLNVGYMEICLMQVTLYSNEKQVDNGLSASPDRLVCGVRGELMESDYQP
jgi:hypothetical protein